MTENTVLTAMARENEQTAQELSDTADALKKAKKASANNDDDENRHERVRDRPDVSGSGAKVYRNRKPDKYGWLFSLSELDEGLDVILSRENLTQTEINEFRREKEAYFKEKQRMEADSIKAVELELPEPADEQENMPHHHHKQLERNDSWAR